MVWAGAIGIGAVTGVVEDTKVFVVLLVDVKVVEILFWLVVLLTIDMVSLLFEMISSDPGGFLLSEYVSFPC